MAPAEGEEPKPFLPVGARGLGEPFWQPNFGVLVAEGFPSWVLEDFQPKPSALPPLQAPMGRTGAAGDPGEAKFWGGGSLLRALPFPLPISTVRKRCPGGGRRAPAPTKATLEVVGREQDLANRAGLARGGDIFGDAPKLLCPRFYGRKSRQKDEV